MANALKRNLKAGDKIVFQDGTVATCGGQLLGSMSFTSGTALDVTVNGELVRADGFDIDPAETMRRFAVENGWEKEAVK